MGLLIFGTGGGGGTGTDLSADTVTPQQVRNPYTFHDANGEARIGEIYNWDGTLLSGGSSDVNKMTVAASTNTRHLKAGSYLARDIELSAMPSGSTAMRQSGSTVLLDKTAGYIAGGQDSLALSAGYIDKEVVGTNLVLTKHSGYIPEGTEYVSIPLEYGTRNVTTNGTHTFTPSSGNVGMGSLSVYVNVSSGSTVDHPAPVINSLNNSSSILSIAHVQSSGNVTGGTSYATFDLKNFSSYLKPEYIRDSYTIFGVTGNYSGSSQSLSFDGNDALSLSGQTATIICKSTVQMISIISNSTNVNAIAAVMACRKNNTCYYYTPSGGRNTGTISWGTDRVTLTLTNSNSWYLSGSYRVMYAYLA